jgi:hypothetical protein
MTKHPRQTIEGEAIRIFKIVHPDRYEAVSDVFCGRLFFRLLKRSSIEARRTFWKTNQPLILDLLARVRFNPSGLFLLILELRIFQKSLRKQ